MVNYTRGIVEKAIFLLSLLSRNRHTIILFDKIVDHKPHHGGLCLWKILEQFLFHEQTKHIVENTIRPDIGANCDLVNSERMEKGTFSIHVEEKYKISDLRHNDDPISRLIIIEISHVRGFNVNNNNYYYYSYYTARIFRITSMCTAQ